SHLCLLLSCHPFLIPFFYRVSRRRDLHSFPTRRSSDLGQQFAVSLPRLATVALGGGVSMGWSWDLTRHVNVAFSGGLRRMGVIRSEEHTSELQSRENLVCRLLLEKKKNSLRI